MPLETTNVTERSASIHTLSLKCSRLCRSLSRISISWQSPGLRMQASYQVPSSQELRLHLAVLVIRKSLVVVVGVPFCQSKNSKAELSSDAWLWTHPVSGCSLTPTRWQFLDKWILFWQQKEGITERVFPRQVTWAQSSGFIHTS